MITNENNYGELLNTISISILAISMILLLYQMRQFHSFEYQLIKFSIFYFVTFEMFGQFLPLIGEIGRNISTVIEFRVWIEMAMHTGLYPVL